MKASVEPATSRYVRRQRRALGLGAQAAPGFVFAAISVQPDAPSLRALADELGVSKSAGARARAALLAGREPGQSGRARYLWGAEEEALAALVASRADEGRPLTLRELRKEMEEAALMRRDLFPGILFPPTMEATAKMARSFLARRGLRLRLSETIEAQKSIAVVKTSIADHFSTLGAILARATNPQRFFINMDETAMKPPKRQRIRVAVPEDVTPAYPPKAPAKKRITMVATITGDGGVLTPLFLIHNTKIPMGIMAVSEDDAPFPDAAYRHSPKAWMTTDIFREWVRGVLVPGLSEWG